jgi:hypothetical protein
MARRSRRLAAGVLRTVPATVLAVLLTAGLLLWPVASAYLPDSGESQAELVRITDYRADFTLGRDGRLDATETVTAFFPPGRHGIFRFWDVADQGDAHVRLVPRSIEVTRDGQDEPFELSWTGGHRYRVAKIGDAETVLTTGSHTYTIRYAVEGALAARSAPSGPGGSWVSDGSDGSSFVWALVPGGWAMPIDRATLTVRLPEEAEDAACAIGAEASEPCEVVQDGATLTVRADGLPPRTPVSVRADLPQDPPGRHTVPWSVAWDGMLGRSELLLGLLLLLSACTFAVGRWWAGRAAEDDPGQPVTYAPPDGLGPVQAHFVVHERLPGDALVATLLHQAEQGLTRLERLSEEQWRIEGVATAQQWAAVDPVSHMVATRLGIDGPGQVFEADGSVEAGKTLQAVQQDLGSIAKQAAVNDGLLVSVGSERRHQVLVVLAGVAGVVLAVVAPGGLTMAAAPALALLLGGAPLLSSGVGTRRTARGREAWSRAAGFRRLLATPSSEVRFDFSSRKELYTAYIPYAVAFGCADAWAEKYRRAMNEPPPEPAWYPVSTGGGGWFGGDGGGFASFESSLQSSISAYQATQSSSSSGGGGGGGFSGGGGGGGGSW